MNNEVNEGLDYTIAVIFMCCIVISCYLTRLVGGFTVTNQNNNPYKLLARPIQVSRVSNPFSVSILNQQAASTENGIELEVRSKTVGLFNSFWGVKIDQTYRIISDIQERIRKTGWKRRLLSDAFASISEVNSHSIRIEECKPNIVNCKLLHNQRISLGSLPRSSYPLVIIIEEERVDVLEDKYVIALIMVIHLPDEFFKQNCEILQKSVLTIDGHIYQLQKIFAVDQENESLQTESDLISTDNTIENEELNNIGKLKQHHPA
ncbi:uncharacterized protein TRIADDRAFT_59798 [Trichoplax adhaerens]|uniref:Uncharacterized protein n=1 Tax=Trichoplax adhaerens TaxID=10228 RepID=B3S6G6_TRIAD|nr:hypothetical protein TRIADDRAFT_59798 [Trichoplax adhaerens]EDV21756.1 hypothetical protein TRIADDRAFT_59798 [Trichoplax adhaerens]|eukprot:XP_002115904.1 hypothetical protein TRIADDRAFT_59798 [Trichoplax adhaerens]